MAEDTTGIENISLDQVLAEGTTQHADAVQKAEAVRKWWSLTRTYGEQKLADDPNKLVMANDKVDQHTQQVLDQLRVEAVKSWQNEWLPNDAATKQFFDLRKEAGGDLTKMGDFAPAEVAFRDLEKLKVFDIPQAGREFHALEDPNGNKLASYRVQPAPDGNLNVLVNVPTPEGGLAGSGMFRVPPVTAKDIEDEKTLAQDSLNSIEHEIRYFNQPPDSFSGLFSGLTGGANLSDPGGGQLRELQAKQTELENRLEVLHTDQASPMLFAERVAEELKKSPLADKIGPQGFSAKAGALFEDMNRGFTRTLYEIAATYNDVTGDKENRQMFIDAASSLGQTMPGSYGARFRGGVGKVASELADMSGGMIPVIAAGAASGGAGVLMAGVQGAASSDVAALELAAQLRRQAETARNAKDTERADRYEKLANDAEAQRGVFATASGINMALAGHIIPGLKGERLVHHAARGAVEMTGINLIQGQIIDPAFTGQRMSAEETAKQSVIGVGMGIAGHIAGKLKERAKNALNRRREASTPDNGAPPQQPGSEGQPQPPPQSQPGQTDPAQSGQAQPQPGQEIPPFEPTPDVRAATAVVATNPGAVEAAKKAALLLNDPAAAATISEVEARSELPPDATIAQKTERVEQQIRTLSPVADPIAELRAIARSAGMSEGEYLDHLAKMRDQLAQARMKEVLAPPQEPPPTPNNGPQKEKEVPQITREPRQARGLTELEKIKDSPEFRRRFSHDIIGQIQSEIGKIQPPELVVRRNEKGQITGELADQYKGGEWDWFRDFLDGTRKRGSEGEARFKELYREVFSQKGVPLDNAAGYLKDKLGGQSLGDAITEALATRDEAARAILTERNTPDAGDTAIAQEAKWNAATKDGAKEVSTFDLNPGDSVMVDGEIVKVKEQLENGDLVLEDGAKFGRQIMENGDTIYVEDVNKKPKADDGLGQDVQPPSGQRYELARTGAAGDKWTWVDTKTGEKSFLMGTKEWAQEQVDKKNGVKRPSSGLFSESDMPFNLEHQNDPSKPLAPPTNDQAKFGNETLTQHDLFAIEKMVTAKDPFKSADAAEKMYGDASTAASKLREQLRILDSNKGAKKEFDKEQRARLNEVLNVLDQRAAKNGTEDRITPSETVFDRAAKGDESAFQEIDAMKRDRLGDPPKGRAGQDFQDRFFTTKAFEEFFNKAHTNGDLEAATMAVKDTDAPIYIPYLKQLMKDAAKGDAVAKDRLEWMNHILTGAPRPASAKAPAPKPPQPGQPPPSGGTPTPPPPREPPLPQPPPAPRTEGFNMPAMVYFAKQLGASTAINRRMKTARGRMIPDVGLELHAHVNKDPVQAGKTLAHEIGHWVDFIFESAGKGILNRFTPLRDYAKTFQTLFTHFSGDIAKISKTIRKEITQLSADWRPGYDPNSAYRNSSRELYADFFSALLNDPEWTARRAPFTTAAFFAGLDEKPAAQEAFNMVNQLLKTDALYKTLQAEAGDASHAALEESIAKDAERHRERHLLKGAVKWVYQNLISRHGLVAAKAGGYRESVRERARSFGDDYAFKQETNEAHYHKALAELDTRMRRDVYTPLQMHGIDAQRLGDLLFYRRIIDEDTLTGLRMKADPEMARHLFEWMIDTSYSGAKWKAELDATPDHELEKFGAKFVWELHQHQNFDAVLQAAQRIDAPEFAEKALFAFDISKYKLNPQGYQEADAKTAMQKMEKELGSQRWSVLNKSAADFYSIAKDSAVEANRLGLFKPGTWAERIAPNLDNYVPFTVLDYFTGFVDAGIRARYGTDKLIMRPDIAMQMKLMAMQRRIGHQKLALTLNEWMEGPVSRFGGADEMVVHAKRLDEGQIRQIENAGGGVIGFWDRGTYKHMEFKDAVVANSIGHFNPEDFQAVMGNIRAFNGFYRVLLTAMNIGFQVNNARRTIQSAFGDLGWKNVTNLFRRDTWKTALEYADAVLGKPMTPRIEQLVKDGVLPPPHRSMTALTLTPGQLTNMVHQGLISVMDAKGDKLNTLTARTLRAIDEKSPAIGGAIKAVWSVPQAFWGKATKASATVEALPKIAGFKTMLDRGATTSKAAAVANLEGIAFPTVNTKLTNLAEMLFLYYRVHVQGLRALGVKMTSPELRSGFITRSLILMGLPIIMTQLAGSGALDKAANKIMGATPGNEQTDIEEMYRRATPYKLEHYFLFPVGWLDPDGAFHLPVGHSSIPKSWTPIFANLGNSEDSRFIQPIMLNTFHAGLDAMGLGSNLSPVRPVERISQNIADFLIPSQNPGIAAISDMTNLFSLTPPIDSYTGRPKVSEDDWKAGFLHRTGALLKYEGGELGQLLSLGAIRNTPANQDLPSWAQIVQHIPGANTLFTLDNYAGVREESRVRVEEAAADARARLARGEQTVNAIKRYEYLQMKQERRTSAEEAEYALLGQWHAKFYQGSKNTPGLFQLMKDYERAGKKFGTNEENGQYARDRLEEMAKLYMDMADNIRKSN